MKYGFGLGGGQFRSLPWLFALSTLIVAASLWTDFAYGVDFPFTLDKGPQAHFVLYGEALASPLVFTHADGSLFINGRKAYPPPPPIPSPLSESDLARLCGQVPYVQRRVAETGDIRKAVEEFEAKRTALINRVGEVWRRLRDEALAGADSLSPSAAMRLYDVIGDSALTYLDDTDVVGELSVARQRARISMFGKLVFYAPGEKYPENTAFVGHGPPPADPARFSAGQLATRVEGFLPFLQTSRVAIVIVSRGAEVCAIGPSAQRLLDDIVSIRANPSAEARSLSREQVYELLNPGWE